ncbi:MAG: LacI family DNA-binding transcriptional regulator [Hungatella sp.]
MKKVSIKDVAKEAGVSITTVSRALNGYMDVSEKTRKHILEVVERLDYAPDLNARSLGGKADTTIALLTSELTPTNESGFVYGLNSGLFRQCNDMGCEFVLLATNTMKQQKLSFLQLCKRKNLSGVVVTGLKVDDPYYHEILDSDIPCAIIDMPVRGRKKCEIAVDNVAASKEATAYLIGLGHRNIGMINGGKTADVSGQRYSGYVSALVEAGIPLQLDYMKYCDFLEDTACEKTEELLTKYPEITALFCASDVMAIGAIRAVEQMGMRVPEDISVMGFDDIPIAPYVYKGISTVRQSPLLMGIEGGKAIWKMLSGEEVDSRVILPHEMVIRGTTGKARV